MSAKAIFWLLIAAALFHASALQAGILVVVYFACTAFDQWQENRRIKKVINAIGEETDGWEADPDDPRSEIRGHLTRLKLSNEDAILVHRVGGILREMQRAQLHDLPDIR